MNSCVRLLLPNDAEQFQEVMTRSFSAAQGFATGSAATEWQAGEEFYYCLGAFREEKLISVMNLEWIFEAKELARKLRTEFTHRQLVFPVAYISKTATLPKNQAQGFNTLLRYHCLQLAKMWQTSMLFGIMTEGSARVFTMTEMGYEFQKTKGLWSGSYLNHQASMLGVLTSDRYESALSYMEGKIPELLKKFPLQSDLSQLKMKLHPA